MNVPFIKLKSRLGHSPPRHAMHSFHLSLTSPFLFQPNFSGFLSPLYDV